MFRGRADVEPSVKIFGVIWLSGAIVIGFPMFCGGGTAGLIFLPAMLAFGAIVVSLGRFLARDEERFLVAFLAGVLDTPGTDRLVRPANGPQEFPSNTS